MANTITKLNDLLTPEQKHTLKTTGRVYTDWMPTGISKSEIKCCQKHHLLYSTESCICIAENKDDGTYKMFQSVKDKVKHNK